MEFLDGHIAYFRQRRSFSRSLHEPTRWVEHIMIFHSTGRTVDNHIHDIYLYNNTKPYMAHFQVFNFPLLPATHMREMLLSRDRAAALCCTSQF